MLSFALWLRRNLSLIVLAVFIAYHAPFSALAQSNTPLTNFPTFSSTIVAIAVSGNVIYVGGNFTQATNSPSNGGATISRVGIAAIDAATGALLPWNPNSNGLVVALAVSGTTVYAGGSFTNIGGAVRNNIAALDAVTGNATAWDPNSNSTVVALAVSGTTVYVGGQFATIGGAGRNHIAALDVVTGNATAWNPNANSTIAALAVSGTTVYAGGNFSYIGGAVRNSIAALDAVTGNATTWDPNSNSTIVALAVSGTTVYAGGSFTTIGGAGRSCIVALDAATGNATAWNPNANNAVHALAVNGTTVYAGGNFTTIGGVGRSRMAALDAATGNSTAWDPNPNGTVGCFAVNGTEVYAGGSIFSGGFTTIGGNPRSHFAAFSNGIYGITSFSPAFGGAGTSVVITGSGFTGTTAVSFGGIPASSFTVNSDTQITAVVGSSTAVTGGQQLVIVTAPAGTFSLGGFGIGATAQSGGTTPAGSTVPQSAVISAFSPQSLSYGTPVTLSGSGFTGATGLLIGGVPVTNFVVVNDNTITAVVGGVPVNDRVQLVGGLGTSLDMSGLGLSYNRLPSPAVATISPATLTASGDDATLVFTGFNFLSGARVLVREQSASVNADVSIPTSGVSTNQATATLPGILRSPGTKVITLLNPDGQSSSITLMVVTGASVRLTGNGGNESAPFVFTTTASGRAFSVRLTGANIFRTVQGFVGDVQTRVTVTSSTEAILEVPASVNELGGNSLTLRLLNSDGQSTTATLRIERRPPPTIVSVSIQSGGILLVRGVNFLSGIRVALANTPLTVLSQESDVALTARIPASFRLAANTPTVSLTVENPDGRAHGVLLPRSLFESASAGISSVHGVSTERTWEAGSMPELLEAQAVKQVQGGIQEMSVYPNPVEGELRIGGTDVRTVRLYDMRGVVVLEERTVSGVVNVSNVNSG